ncbi:MAG: hypothetical protein ACYTHM_21265 [Planctomycetota bacterium]|jgi:hypothetical protein
MAKGRKKGANAIQGSAEARRLAHVVLEVLAGLRGPSEAAEVLSVSLPRYYVLETRALEGLVKALEPREKGKRGRSAESRLESLTRERDRMKTELERMRSLVRLTQRAVGLSSRGGKGKRQEEGEKGRKKGRRGKRKRNVLSRLTPESGEGASKCRETPRAAEPQKAPVRP